MINLEEIAKINQGDAIAIIWSIVDVYAAADEREEALSEEEARQVLRNVEANHDAMYGVSWSSINDEIDNILLDREV